MVEEGEESGPEGMGVLLDRIVFGLTMEMPTPFSLPEIATRLHGHSIATLAGPVRGGRATMDLECRVIDLPSNGEVSMAGRLRLEAGMGSVRVLGGSHLELNGMRLLRTQVEAPPDPAEGLAGDNFVGPVDENWPAYLDLQVAGIATAVDAVVEGLAEAAGAPLPVAGHLRLRWAEACRDLSAADAPAFARRLASRWLGGHLRTQRHYPGDMELEGVLPTVSWGKGSRHAPVQKVYAKAGDLLRTEVTARRAEAVGHLLAGRRRAADAEASLAPEAVADLLRRFAGAAAPLLEEAREVVEEVEESAQAPIELLLRLTPLLALAAPPLRRSPGRPVSEVGRAAAREAVESLLHIGRVTTRGLRGGTALRRVLDDMAEGENAVLRRYGATGASFALRPCWAEARGLLVAPGPSESREP